VQYNPDLVKEIWGIASELGMSGFIDMVNYGIDDDHLILNKAGIPSIDIIDFNYPDQKNSYWHTHRDTPENCSAQSLEQVGSVILEYIYRR
jgi:Iap family predicted aminopeptidase